MITTTRPDNTSCAPIPQLSRDVTIVWEAGSVQILIYYYMLQHRSALSCFGQCSQPQPERSPGLGLGRSFSAASLTLPLGTPRDISY